MIKAAFETFLKREASISSEKAIMSRIAKAQKAESILGFSLDYIVSDDDIMFEALIELQKYENPAHNPMQNAVRKYYKFVHGKEFPRLNDYHSPKHP